MERQVYYTSEKLDSAYFDDGDNVSRGLTELGQIHVKVGQLIPLSLLMDISGSFSNGMNAS